MLIQTTTVKAEIELATVMVREKVSSWVWFSFFFFLVTKYYG
jgi:hypothetical protein